MKSVGGRSSSVSFFRIEEGIETVMDGYYGRGWPCIMMKAVEVDILCMIVMICDIDGQRNPVCGDVIENEL